MTSRSEPGPETPTLVDGAIEISERLEREIPEQWKPEEVPATIDEENANALGLHVANLERVAAQVEAQVARYVERLRRRVKRIEEYYGKAMLTFAQEVIANKSPRRIDLPLVRLSLRKAPDKVVMKDDAESVKKFRAWDASKAEFAYTRIVARFDSLTHEQLQGIIDRLTEEQLALMQWRVEVRKEELNKYVKKSGEIPPGVEVIVGQDGLTISLTEEADAD